MGGQIAVKGVGWINHRFWTSIPTGSIFEVLFNVYLTFSIQWLIKLSYSLAYSHRNMNAGAQTKSFYNSARAIFCVPIISSKASLTHSYPHYMYHYLQCIFLFPRPQQCFSAKWCALLYSSWFTTKLKTRAGIRSQTATKTSILLYCCLPPCLTW